MKKTKIFYWIFTSLFALMMFASSIPNIISTDESVTVFKAMQLPPYLLPFLGVAKLLGVIGILVPGFPRVREWAYAGLFFDLIGASYCIYASSGSLVGVSFMILPIGMGILSYIFAHKKDRLAAATSTKYNGARGSELAIQ